MAEEIAVQTESKPATFSDKLMGKLVSVDEALPKDFNKTRFVQNALALINDNPNLQKVPQAQLMSGLMKGAYLGLDFFNKEAHLIPFGNNVQFIPDVKGSRKLVKKYSIKPIDDIDSFLVREGDEFEPKIIGGKKSFEFKPIPFNGGEIIGAVAYVVYSDGTTKWEQMNIDELEAARNQSKASNSPAWKNFRGEMYRKTVIHRLCKQIELEFENPNQNNLFLAGNEIETEQKPVEVDNPFDVVDVEGEIVGEDTNS